jgi:excisionase family DNA binding protein
MREAIRMQDRWLSVEEIAVYLGVSRDTIYSWVGKTGIPAHKVGRLWKFKLSEVDKWVKSGASAGQAIGVRTDSVSKRGPKAG